MPDGHMSPRQVSGRGVAAGSSMSPVCDVHADVCPCFSCSSCRLLLFWSRSRSMSFPTTSAPVASMMGGSKPSNASSWFIRIVALKPLLSGPGSCRRSLLPRCSSCIEYPFSRLLDGLLLVGIAPALSSPRGSTSAHITGHISPCPPSSRGARNESSGCTPCGTSDPVLGAVCFVSGPS